MCPFWMNVINVAGNAIGVFLFHAGVAGVALPTLISRAVAAVVMTCLSAAKKHRVYQSRTGLFLESRHDTAHPAHCGAQQYRKRPVFTGQSVGHQYCGPVWDSSEIAANGGQQH